ncbi:hypothetical protein A3B60_01725 [Candidatus Peregrinibacteria bacterium RIFCSPLOWO2_01_FULL_39_12]|nr:MAG: hypothetical protein A3B60_01725 [Candidatus Peregrinibacteria bacterium RIFCSPLOWO2_01_FULL_39_12]
MVFILKIRYKFIVLIFSVFLASFLPFIEVFAATKTYESFISTDLSKIEFSGTFPGGQFGSAIASGDFNGDGIDDLFVGSPFTSVHEMQWNGSLSIIFGGESGDRNELVYYGDNSGDQLGTAIASGDFDNDGFSDVAVSAYYASVDDKNSSDKENRPGKVYVIYGNSGLSDQSALDSQTGSQLHSQLSSQNDDSISNKSARQFAGKNSGDNFGLALEVSDINNDDIDDLLVGAPQALTSNSGNAGAVYAYFGSDVSLSAEKNITFYGHHFGEKFGSSIASGDFTGDGKTDLVISAYLAHFDELSQVGRVYLYYGLKKNPSVVKLETTSLRGKSEKEWFGFDLDIKDINGDKKDDIAISSLPLNGDRKENKISIFYGRKKFSENISPDIVISEPINQSLIGADVLMANLEGDNKADIIIGAPGISNIKSSDAGDVYIIYGGSEDFKPYYSIESFNMDSLINGEDFDDWFGYGLDTLDFNADGFLDLAIGSRYSDTKNGVNNGKVFILLGDGNPFGRIKQIVSKADKEITRGRLVSVVLKNLDLKNKKADYIQACYNFKEFCLFNFMAMSSYNDIQLDPYLVLYPDVQPNHQYFDDINTATILGLVNGSMNDKDSPFYPDKPVTRIQALKIVLGAADLVPSKYQFELIAMLGSYKNLLNQSTNFTDIDTKISYMWWYPRYVNFALEHDIIDESDYFRPDENITASELNDLISRTLNYLNSQ